MKRRMQEEVTWNTYLRSLVLLCTGEDVRKLRAIGTSIPVHNFSPLPSVNPVMRINIGHILMDYGRPHLKWCDSYRNHLYCDPINMAHNTLKKNHQSIQTVFLLYVVVIYTSNT
ncbi:hypothetical protein Pst134EA_017973 [Puccinia striiformis f. sp. tritici]|uniref:hypothetical protein n=1 Tax=Puccinia striiformis f. sp. tritici TaxID=168172 RepID=UPI002007623E|nr:hypothetical protein Pst134EA_017973 [Puccinia striiformis f. sp. tritici]KAH9461684.1 hypothetical protein Pst134EA_017973 [Puccinia striiformis f. sp. tritici]